MWRKLPRITIPAELGVNFKVGVETLVVSAMVLETNNFFEIFSLPVTWQIGRSLLDTRYRNLQREFHPDRYAAKGDTEKRLAVQTTALINQAYDSLKSPLKRAQYLLELAHIDANQESHITSDGAFLMQQIEFREALADLRESSDAASELDSMHGQVQDNYLKLQNDFAAQHSAAQYNDAFDTVAKMQFFAKLLDEIEQRQEELEDY